MFENKILRNIFGAKRDEMENGGSYIMLNYVYALHSSPKIFRNHKSRRLSWAGHVARMEQSRNAYRVSVGKPEGKKPLGRPRRR